MTTKRVMTLERRGERSISRPETVLDFWKVRGRRDCTEWCAGAEEVSKLLNDQWVWETFLVGEPERGSKNRGGSRDQKWVKNGQKWKWFIEGLFWEHLYKCTLPSTHLPPPPTNGMEVQSQTKIRWLLSGGSRGLRVAVGALSFILA